MSEQAINSLKDAKNDLVPSSVEWVEIPCQRMMHEYSGRNPDIIYLESLLVQEEKTFDNSTQQLPSDSLKPK